MHLLLSQLTLIGLVNCKLHIVNILQIVTLAFSDFHSCNFSKWFSDTILWNSMNEANMAWNQIYTKQLVVSLSDQISWEEKGRMNILTKLYYASQLICIQFQMFLCFILNQLCRSRTYMIVDFIPIFIESLPYE